MGEMVDGTWRGDEDLAHAEDGHFRRPPTRFRGTIAAGGPHPPAAGRYHLYVSLACPWAHRALIVRRLKGLEGIVGLSVTHWLMRDDGWTFAQGPGVAPDPGGARFLHEVYRRADPRYTGRVTVPVLWDIDAGTIVNNESADIIRIFNAGFDAVGARPGDLYPEALRPEIDAVNARIYETLNNGVYRAGFATSQDAYEAAVGPLFDTMDWLEQRLSRQPYLCGAEPTEADWRLFTTLVRFERRLPRPFQVQPAPPGRLPGPVGLCAPPVPVAGGGGDRRPATHQGPLLREPSRHQPDRHRAARPRDGLGRAGRARLTPGCPAAGAGRARFRAAAPARRGSSAGRRG